MELSDKMRWYVIRHAKPADTDWGMARWRGYLPHDRIARKVLEAVMYNYDEPGDWKLYFMAMDGQHIKITTRSIAERVSAEG